MFLEECKYVVKEKKIPKYIIDDVEICSDSDEESSDEENSDEKNSDEKNFDENNFDEENFKNTDMTNKNVFCIYIKMVNKYYQKNKEKLQKEAREIYQNFSEEEKDKRQKRSERDNKIFLKSKSKNYLNV